MKKTEKSQSFINLFYNLIYGDSELFYKNIIKTYNYNYNLPTYKDFSKFSKIINSINRFCVGIGTSELLAPFALHLLTLIKNSSYNKDNIITIIKKYNFIVSSMKDEVWSPRNNQFIIIDTMLDKPDVNVEYWDITNGALALIMPKPIHNNKNELDFSLALQLVKCRVTRDEICLIDKIINNNKNQYIIKCYI